MNDVCWSRFRTAYAKGAAFIIERPFTASALAEKLAASSSFEGFVSILRELNGFFAAIRIIDDSAFLAVDHVRSFPLFYAVRGKDVFVSDDAYWVREKVRDDRVDEFSAIEFLLTRSVSGSDTLTPSVKQVQAGEAVALTVTSEAIRKESARFSELSHAESAVEGFDQLIARSDRCLLAAFKRLIEFANGRTFVVPLSGGLDSRLVVLMLQRTGCDKVVCFTYGRPGNRETKISRKIALELGFRWKFIPYSNDSWRDWYNSGEWSAYSRFASSLCSTPYLQDWPAVWELKQKQLIPDDSIFLPGHMPVPNHVGAHKLPVEWLNKSSISVDELTGKICEMYCTLQDWPTHKAALEPELIKKIERVLQPPTTLTPKQAIDYFDRWGWESSIAKFVINSVRVYEFWGYQWWLPLCDLELVHFWLSLPFQLGFEKRFQKAYVRTLETDITRKPAITDTSRHDFGPVLIRISKKLHLRNSARRIRARVEFGRHHFAWYGLIPEKDYRRAFHGQENINTYLANQTLKSIFPYWEIPEGLDFLANASASKPRSEHMDED